MTNFTSLSSSLRLSLSLNHEQLQGLTLSLSLPNVSHLFPRESRMKRIIWRRESFLIKTATQNLKQLLIHQLLNGMTDLSLFTRRALSLSLSLLQFLFFHNSRPTTVFIISIIYLSLYRFIYGILFSLSHERPSVLKRFLRA